MVVVCGNSDEQIINTQTKTKKLVSLHKRGINVFRDLTQNFIHEKSQKTKIRTWD